jgi:hypothetical protein
MPARAARIAAIIPAAPPPMTRLWGNASIMLYPIILQSVMNHKHRPDAALYTLTLDDTAAIFFGLYILKI